METGNTNFKYSLIRLTLQKNWKAAPGERNSIVHSGRAITVLGYYDRLIFENLDDWYALRPGIINAHSSPKEFSDEYTLRLVAPDWAKKACEERKTHKGIFDYAYFDRFESGEGQQAGTESSTERPLFSVFLINCSDEKLKGVSTREELFDEILDAVVESVKKTDLYALKIGIYLSLGYSEFALLISGNGAQDINGLIDEIRLRLLGKCASSTYTVLGFDETLIDSVRTDEKIDVTIDFSMIPGKTLEESDFLQLFVYNLAEKELVPEKKWDELSKAEQEQLLVEAQKHGYAEPVMLMGAIDWRWELKDCSLAQFFHAYKGDTTYEGKLKSFGNDSDLFKVVHTKLQLKRTTNPYEEPNRITQEKVPNVADKKFEDAYRTFETLYHCLIAKSFVHRRSLYAMQGIKYLYDKVVSSSYGGDVKKLTEPFFHDFLDVMNGRMKWLLDGDQEMGEKEKKRKEFLAITEGIDSFLGKSIQSFRDFFEPYIFAIYRSDHAFFEGQSLVHPSIGSAAKLLFCYNQALYAWEKRYGEWEAEEIKNHPDFRGTSTDFSYLVTSGGVDSTDNLDMFDQISNFLSSADSTRSTRVSRPLIVMMSEAGLYNIDGTLFKLAHEFFHKRGNRMRCERTLAYIKDICYIVAESIANWFVREWLKDKIRDRLCHIMAFDKRKKIQTKNVNEAEEEKVASEIYFEHQTIMQDPQMAEFENTLRDALFPILYNEGLKCRATAKASQDPLSAWHVRNLRGSCKEFLRKEWKLREDDFWRGYTYQPEGSDGKIDTIRKTIACKIYELGRQLSNKIFFPTVKDKAAESAGGKKEKIFILRPDFEIDPVYMDESLFVFDRKEGIRKAMVSALQNQEKFKMWERLAKECFADCLAIKTMAQKEDDPADPWGKERGILSYLRAFLFEVRNPNELWKVNYGKENSFWSYRIFIIKELLGWSSGPEGEELKEEIGTWYDTCFYPGQNTSVDKKAYVNNVIAAWQDLKNAWNRQDGWGEMYGRPYQGLMAYLKTCISNNESLCRSLQEVHVPALGNGEDTIKVFSEFVFEKWMEIYRENVKGDANG